MQTAVQLHDWMDWAVFFLASSVFALCLGAVIFIVLREKGWTGPSQDGRLRELEKDRDAMRRRQNSLEENQRRIFEEFMEAVRSLSAQIRSLSESVSGFGHALNRVSALEAKHDDLEQALQSFRDLGCGHSDCPHRREVARA